METKGFPSTCACPCSTTSGSTNARHPPTQTCCLPERWIPFLRIMRHKTGRAAVLGLKGDPSPKMICNLDNCNNAWATLMAFPGTCHANSIDPGNLIVDGSPKQAACSQGLKNRGPFLDGVNITHKPLCAK